MSKLIVVVPVGRRASGRAVLLGNDGRLRVAPFRVLATASGSAAARHGNPGRDWRRPFGHLPTGSYVIAGVVPPSAAPRSGAQPRSEPLGALVLAPVAGNALEALRAGRTRFLLHGGAADASGRLRCTFGGLRVSDADLASLVRAINQANAEGDPATSVEVDETSTPTWTEQSDDEVPSSRGGARKQQPKVPRGVLAGYGFGGRGRPVTPGRRAFLGLALFTFGALGFACGGSDLAGGSGDEGEGGAAGGQDGGGEGGGYEGGVDARDAGRREAGDAGAGEGGEGGEGGEQEDGAAGGTTTGGGGGGGTTTDTTTTGTDTTTTATDTTTTSTVTTGTDTTTGPAPTTTTGTDTTTTATVTTGTDTTTTGIDTTTTGTDTTTWTDTTTTGTDTTTTGTDTTTTGTDTTTTGTDTTTTGTDTTTFDVKPKKSKRRTPPIDEGSGL